MKNSVLPVLLFVLLWGCGKPANPDPTTPPPPAGTPNPAGEWVAAQGGGGGFNNFDTFKNFQYTFEVATANQVVSIGLTSPDINVQFALFDPLGQRIDVSSQGRNVSKTYPLNAGKHRVVVVSDRRAVGRFSLSLAGTKDGATLLPSKQLQSNTQNWGPLGGGGRELTFKNHFYTFDVTDDNTSIDLELESADTEVALGLYDALGARVDGFEYGQRYEFKIKSAKKGTYKVMAATNTRSKIGNYNLRVTGQVDKLQRTDSQATTLTGNWPNSAAADTYSLRITSAANSPLDIEASSPDANPYIYLQSATGASLETRSQPARLNFLTSAALPQGNYRIKVSPGGSREFGNYTLIVHGQFADLKKL